MQKRIVFLIMLMTFLTMMAGCGAKPVAVVNGENISQEDYDRTLARDKANYEQMGISFEGEEGKTRLAELEQDVLDQMIDEVLIFQAAKKEGIEVTAEEVELVFQEQKENAFNTEEAYLEWLDQSKMTEDELKQEMNLRYQLTNQELYNKVTAEVTVSDEDMKKLYEQDQASWEKIKVAHILVLVDNQTATQADWDQAKVKADDIIKQLNQGADFAALANQVSEDPGSASQGGLIDMQFTKNEQGLVPEFVAGSFLLKNVGDFSQEPVKSDFGYHIIKLLEQKGSYEEVKDDIKNQLVQTAANEAFDKFWQDFKEAATITKNL